jgi:hypothetical protein
VGTARGQEGDLARCVWLQQTLTATDATWKQPDYANSAPNWVFDPIPEAERLRAPKPSEQNHPKRVLRELSGGDPAREARCWSETPLQAVRERGIRTGLTRFLLHTQGER